jgi:hypothetical protein
VSISKYFLGLCLEIGHDSPLKSQVLLLSLVSIKACNWEGGGDLKIFTLTIIVLFMFQKQQEKLVAVTEYEA